MNNKNTNKLLNKIDKNCFKNIYFHKDISSMLFEGLAYLLLLQNLEKWWE